MLGPLPVTPMPLSYLQSGYLIAIVASILASSLIPRGEVIGIITGVSVGFVVGYFLPSSAFTGNLLLSIAAVVLFWTIARLVEWVIFRLSAKPSEGIWKSLAIFMLFPLANTCGLVSGRGIHLLVRQAAWIAERYVG